eukprot:tig00000203_g17123.t1
MAEEQLVLRVPPALAERLREAMRRGGDMNADFTFSEGGRVGQFRFNETTLQCHLVDLPCVVETHKVYDKGTLLKSSDIGQMIVVHEDGPGAWDGEWKDGLTSASRDIRRRRWRPRQKIDQSLLAQTQKHLLRIMNKQANDGIEYELVEEDISANASARKKKKKKKCPVDAMSLDALVDESNQPPVAPSPALPPEDGMDQVAAAIQELGAVYDDGGDLLLENLIDDAFLTEKPAIGEEPASGHDDEQVLMIGIEGHGDAIGEALEGDGADNSNTAQCEMSPRTREMSEDLKRRVSACEEGISSIESKIEQLASHAASAPNPILKSRFLQQKDAQEKLLEKEREKLETLKAEGQL